MTTPSSLFPAQPGCRKTHIHSNFLPRTPRRSAAGGAHRRQRRLTAAVAVRRPPPACSALCDGLAAAGDPPAAGSGSSRTAPAALAPLAAALKLLLLTDHIFVPICSRMLCSRKLRASGEAPWGPCILTARAHALHGHAPQPVWPRACVLLLHRMQLRTQSLHPSQFSWPPPSRRAKKLIVALAASIWFT